MKLKIVLFLVFAFVTFSSNQLFSQDQKARPNQWAVPVRCGNFENLFKLNNEVYRSEQPDHAGFLSLDSLGIKSILNLRSSHTDNELIGKLPFKSYDVPMEADAFTEKEIIEALKIIKNSRKPILVHCAHGADRTGVVIALYRIVVEGWSKEQALDEMIHGDYNFHAKYTNIPGYINGVDLQELKQKLL